MPMIINQVPLDSSKSATQSLLPGGTASQHLQSYPKSLHTRILVSLLSFQAAETSAPSCPSPLYRTEHWFLHLRLLLHSLLPHWALYIPPWNLLLPKDNSAAAATKLPLFPWYLWAQLYPVQPNCCQCSAEVMPLCWVAPSPSHAVIDIKRTAPPKCTCLSGRSRM